ncbi:MAG: hypothetical protein KDC38_14220, partial [Planctomycetes bacterium]|nr:hypothetical protein [Planctomycetota bacterium]
LRGDYRLRATVARPEITLVRESDGRLHPVWERGEGRGSVEEGTEASTEGESVDREPPEMPEFAAALSVDEARVRIVDPEGHALYAWTAKLEAQIDEPGAPVSWRLEATDGAGRAECTGVARLVREGRLDIEGATGNVEYSLERFPLELVGAFVPETDVEGSVTGHGKFDLAGLRRPSGAGDVEFARFRFARRDRRLECETVSLHAELSSDDAPRVTVTGAVRGLAVDQRALDRDIEIQLMAVDGADSFRLDSARCTAPGLEATLSGVWGESDEPGVARVVGRAAVAFDLDALRWIEPFLGEPLPATGNGTLDAVIEGTASAFSVDGKVDLARWTMADADLDWRDERVTYAARVEAIDDGWRVANGVVEGLGVRGELSGALGSTIDALTHVVVSPGPLARRVPALSQLSFQGQPIETDLHLTGALAALAIQGETRVESVEWQGSAGPSSLHCRVTHDLRREAGDALRYQEGVTDLRFVRTATTASSGGPADAWRLQDALTLRGVFVSTDVGPRVTEGTVSGELVRGTYSCQPTEDGGWQVEGDVLYRPEVLAPLVSAWMTIESGERQEEALRFRGTSGPSTVGEADGLERWRGEAHVELPTLRRSGLRIAGPVTLRADDAGIALDGALSANGGTATTRIVLPRDEAATPTTVRLDLATIGVDAGMSELLAVVHPIFARGIGAEWDGAIAGSIGGQLEIDYSGLRSALVSANGWTELLALPFVGRGRLEVGALAIRSSPLLDEIFRQLGAAAPAAVTMDPIAFTLRGGRLTYDQPLPMRIDGQKTFWSGSIGFDQSLDLVWRVPVDDALRRRWTILKDVPLDEIEIPVRGLASAPRVDFGALVTHSVKGGVQEAIGGLLGLGSDDDKAKELLGRADRLWDSGDHAGATKLYAEIHDKYRDTLTYRLYRNRIKRRLGG